MGLNPEQIRLVLQISLLGEIYPAIRAIAFDYVVIDKRFTLRYYLDREPVDDDFEKISVVMTEFIANFSYQEFDELEEDCLYSNLPMSELSPLSGFVYLQ